MKINMAADAKGVPGQGDSPNPPAAFGNHFIVKINGKYYDPSYGLGPFADPKKYELAAFDGYIRNAGGLKLFDSPADDGNAANDADQITDFSPHPNMNVFLN